MPAPITSVLVVDSEVTGMDPSKDVPLELASARVQRSRTGSPWLISDLWDTLINPGDVPISFGAMGVHHITPDMVNYAPMLEAAVPKKHLLRDHRVVRAAHNSKFDRDFIEKVFPKTRWICTMKCARRVWPGLDSYSDQALRYALGVNVEPYNLPAAKAHRALFDTIITAEILVALLKEKTPEELLQITCEPVLLDKMPIGEHKDKPFDEVPDSFLRWVVQKGPERVVNGKKTGFGDDLIYTCRKHLGLV